MIIRATIMCMVILAVLASGHVEAQSDATIVHPGAPGEASRGLSRDEIGDLATEHPHTEDDVFFMRGMIPHHAQAIEMVALVADRTSTVPVRALAERIRISQRDELVLIEEWLTARGEVAVGEVGREHHAAGDHSLMPGMLTAAEMDELGMARGIEFDRLFLSSMIRHHEGALAMVRDLFASEAGGREVEIWQFAAHVDSDQRVEIDRMSRLLGELR